MMQALRKKTRYVLFVALAGFALLIFFQWGLDITGVRDEREKNIGEIDGVSIPYSDYVRFARLKLQESRGISRDEIWQSMVEEIVWNNLLKKEKIMVSDDEVWAVIRNNPPREIYESEFMKDENGEFDFNKYYELLKAPQSRPWILEYERSIRRQIPREKFRSLLSSFGWVSPYEDSILIEAQTAEYSISYLGLAVNRARNLLEISEQEMREYYTNNMMEFIQPELKVLKYVFFERRPSVYDTLEARERIEDFVDRVKDGEDFLILAQEVSDDTNIVVEFEDETETRSSLLEVYRKLKNGEMSEVIETTQGFEVIKREKRGVVHRVAMKVDVSQTTMGEIYDKIMSFKDLAQEWGFDSAGVDFEIKVRKTFPLSSDNVTFPVRNQELLGEFVTEAKMGEIGGPFTSFGGYYLFKLDTIIPETRPSFEDVVPQVKAKIEKEKIKEVIRQRLDEYHDRLIAGIPMENIASEDTIVTFRASDAMTLGQVQMKLGAEFAGVVASLESGQLASPLVTDRGGYIIRCDAKTVRPFDSTMIAELQMKRQVRLDMLTVDIFTPQKVKDNRDVFFE
jgi:parvulin-like peptidyl-prolyl isomerase